MALHKRIKVGGSFYKGSKLTVSASTGDYILDMSISTKCVLNGITVIPDGFGLGDTFKLEHLNADGILIKLIANTVYNIGALSAWHFDFAALEEMLEDHKLRLTYTNVAGVSMSIYTLLERIR